MFVGSDVAAGGGYACLLVAMLLLVCLLEVLFNCWYCFVLCGCGVRR